MMNANVWPRSVWQDSDNKVAFAELMDVVKSHWHIMFAKYAENPSSNATFLDLVESREIKDRVSLEELLGYLRVQEVAQQEEALKQLEQGEVKREKSCKLLRRKWFLTMMKPRTTLALTRTQMLREERSMSRKVNQSHKLTKVWIEFRHQNLNYLQAKTQMNSNKLKINLEKQWTTTQYRTSKLTKLKIS